MLPQKPLKIRYLRQWRSQLDKWGGGGGDIFIYSCSALLIYFEIDCVYSL